MDNTQLQINSNSKRRSSATRDPHLLWFVIGSFLIPLAGLLMAAIFAANPSAINRRRTTACLWAAIVSVAIGIVVAAIYYALVVSAFGKFKNEMDKAFKDFEDNQPSVDVDSDQNLDAPPQKTRRQEIREHENKIANEAMVIVRDRGDSFELSDLQPVADQYGITVKSVELILKKRGMLD